MRVTNKILMKNSIAVSLVSLMVLGGCDDKSDKKTAETAVAENQAQTTDAEPNEVVTDHETEAGNQAEVADSWVESSGKIVAVERSDEGFGYTIEYDVTESDDVNADGEKVKGPVQQYAMSEKEPVLNQVVKLKYMKNQPMNFELLDEIQVVAEQEAAVE